MSPHARMRSLPQGENASFEVVQQEAGHAA